MANEQSQRFRQVHKNEADIAIEWDALAEHRADQIDSGRDLSFKYVLIPTVLELAASSEHSDVLDVGCGTGQLSALLASTSTRVLGIDISAGSIDVARRRDADSIDNLEFEVASVQQYSQFHPDRRFTLIVANMVLMATPDLDGVLRSIADVCMDQAFFIATLTHPCFWPTYWGYASEPWYAYTREIEIEAPFAISREADSGFMTTHVHRPLERYVRAFRSFGFEVEVLVEPMPAPDVQSLYPHPWAFPRFLGVCCKRS